MRRTFFTLLVAGFGGAAVNAALAQTPPRFAVEGRVGGAAPTGQWNDTNEINYGMSAGLNAQFWLTPSFGLYAGWDWTRFSMDRPDLAHTIDATAVDSGFRGGAITPYRMRSGATAPFLFAGGLFNRTAYYLSDGREVAGLTSNENLGYEVGGGLSIPLGGSVITPTISYRTHQAVFGPPGGGAGPNEVTVIYILANVGIRVGL